MPNDHRDGISSGLSARIGNLCWNGWDMKIDWAQYIHSRIKQIHREAIRGVHFQINHASGVKLSATGRGQGHQNG